MPDRRQYGRTAMLLFAVVVTTAGCGAGAGAVGAGPVPETSVKESVTVDPAIVTATGPLECGQPFRPPAGGTLTLTGRFPATAAAGDRTLAGTVEVTSRTAVRGVLAPRADVFLVREGRIATVPLAQDSVGVRWDLRPGKAERLPGEVALVACDPGAGSLRPGTYELYVRVALTPDDGTAVESFGGPWPLEVR
jgi:hypothetical protein